MKIDHLSISSINLHKSNPRRWALTYLEGIRDPSPASAEFGSTVHNILEDLVFDGLAKSPSIDPSSYRILMDWYTSFRYRNEKQPGHLWRIEEEFRIWLAPDLPPFVGRIDLWSYNHLSKTLHIMDHKTCHPNYRETTDSLLDNYQLNLYSYAIHPRMDHEELIHIYHNQFIKEVPQSNPPKLKTFEVIENILTKRKRDSIIKEIRDEGYAITKSMDYYKEEGLKGLKATPHNKFWYGKKDPFWECINGDESIEELKQRMQHE